MTENIKELVKKFETKYIDVDIVGMKNTPKFVGSHETINDTYSEVLDTIKQNESIYNIFILACHLDPNLEKLRNKTDKIIIGIGEASILYSQVLGMRYSIIGSSDKTVKLKSEMVNRYKADKNLDYIGYPDASAQGKLEERLLYASEEAIIKYKSDAIVLGCAGFVGVDAFIQKRLDAEIIDGVYISLIIADGYAKYTYYKNGIV